MSTAGVSTYGCGTGQGRSSEIGENLRRALDLYRSGDRRNAGRFIREILQTDPENADALHLLGLIAYDSGEFGPAVNLIRRAISVDDARPVFYHHLGIVLTAKGGLERAAICFQQAIRMAPDYADAYFGLGKIFQMQGRLDEAIKMYNHVLKLNPDANTAVIDLGRTFQSLGDWDKAIACYRRAERKKPGDSEIKLLIASAYLNQDQAGSAKACLEEVLARDPVNVGALFKLALAEEKLNRPESAASAYLQIIDLDSSLPEVFVNLGRVYKAMKDLNKAMDCCRTALTLKPDFAEAHNNMGTILQQLGNHDEAIASFQRALAVDSGSVSALHNLGNAYQKTGRLEEAVDCYRKTLSIKPEFIPAYYHLGLIFQTQKKHTQAIECFRKALSLNPGHTKAACYLFHQLQYVCDWKELEELGVRIDSATRDALNESRRPDETPFLSVSRNVNPALDYEIARAWSNEIEGRTAKAPGTFSADGSFAHLRRVRKRKIIVGYLSGNFKNHPTGHLLSGLFRRHCRDDFTIHCYSFGEDDGSEFRKQIRRGCDRFIEIGTLSHSEAARCIHNDKVDILVDLVGFTHDHRMSIAAMRPAPIQVRWLGMAGTTGAGFFDYIVADSIVVSRADAEFYSEKIAFMPHCYQVNNKDQEIAPKGWSKKDLGLPENVFVFCCFCSRYKLDPIMFDAWMRILIKNPDSVLWLMGGSKTAEKNLKNHARNRRVSPDRLVFARPLPKAEHLARLQHADIALDTSIVNGAATTSDALWAGIPVLTLQGGHFASRMSSSILTALGLPELITCDLETYESVAGQLAQNSGKLNHIRSKLAQGRLTQPLFDTGRFTANLEKAYKKMWKIFLAGEKPRHIHVIEE